MNRWELLQFKHKRVSGTRHSVEAVFRVPDLTLVEAESPVAVRDELEEEFIRLCEEQKLLDVRDIHWEGQVEMLAHATDFRIYGYASKHGKWK